MLTAPGTSHPTMSICHHKQFLFSPEMSIFQPLWSPCSCTVYFIS